MTRLASRFGAANLIRRDRPLTREELFRAVPSVFSEDKHASRSERYTYTRAVRGIDGDVKLNRALWVMAETLLTQMQ